MMRRKSIFFILFCIFIVLADYLEAMVVNVNLLHPSDTLIRPTFCLPSLTHFRITDNHRPYQLAAYVEGGYHNAQGFDQEGEKVNVLDIWQNNQDALAMLEGFAQGSAIDQLRTRLAANDDGVRGHFKVYGTLKYDFGAAFAMRFFFARDYSFDLYLPFYRLKLENVTFLDETLNLSDADRRVKELLTDNFAANVLALGDLDIGPWTRTGVGDLTALFEWFRDFKQNKPLLKMVRINWRVGVTIPTGLPEDENKLFAIPYGNDKAWTIPFAVGLDLNLGLYLKIGLDVQLTQIFGNTRNRRIKTSFDQTDLLLLQKAPAYKDFGLTQRFNLYAEFYRFIKGLSFKVGYQYLKHGDDELDLKTQQFSTVIANSARTLEEFTMHQIITKTTYDFGVDHENSRTRPELGIFTRSPFNGKNVALVPTVGIVFSLDF